MGETSRENEITRDIVGLVETGETDVACKFNVTIDPENKTATLNSGAAIFKTGTGAEEVQELVGAGLPDVTEADNGDILTVVNGVWNKAAPNIDVFYIKKVYDEETDTDTYIADKSIKDTPILPPIAVVYYEDDPFKEYYFLTAMGTYESLTIFPGSDPNLSVIYMYPDPDDSTGKLFKKDFYSGNITLT